MANQIDRTALLEMTSQIVSAYVSHNKIEATDVPGLITQVFDQIQDLSDPHRRNPNAPHPEPAIAIADSVTEEVIYSLEDGQPYKSLKRHLKTRYGMTPEDYRAKWGLPADYPMVAPAYARRRSELAKKTGLGK